MDRFLLDPHWRLLVVVGFLGSQTSFSSYTVESLNLILKGQAWLGLLYLLGSSLPGGLAAVAGALLAKSL